MTDKYPYHTTFISKAELAKLRKSQAAYRGWCARYRREIERLHPTWLRAICAHIDIALENVELEAENKRMVDESGKDFLKDEVVAVAARENAILEQRIKELETRYAEWRERAEKMEARIEAAKHCVRYQTVVEVNGQKMNVDCFLKDQVLAKLGMNFTERYKHTKALERSK